MRELLYWGRAILVMFLAKTAKLISRSFFKDYFQFERSKYFHLMENMAKCGYVN